MATEGPEQAPNAKASNKQRQANAFFTLYSIKKKQNPIIGQHLADYWVV
jgi:hypothetical protein